MDFSKSILSDKPYLRWVATAWLTTEVVAAAVVVAEVAQVREVGKNNILEMSRRLCLSKSIRRVLGGGGGQRGGIFMKAIFPVWNKSETDIQFPKKPVSLTPGESMCAPVKVQFSLLYMVIDSGVGLFGE